MKIDEARIVVGIPSYDGRIEGRILVMLREMLDIKLKVIIAEGAYIEDNRNRMILFATQGLADKALGGSFTHVLMLDSD